MHREWAQTSVIINNELNSACGKLRIIIKYVCMYTPLYETNLQVYQFEFNRQEQGVGIVEICTYY